MWLNWWNIGGYRKLLLELGNQTDTLLKNLNNYRILIETMPQNYSKRRGYKNPEHTS